jgi:hypothetical protein
VILATAKLTFNANVRTLPEACGVLRQLRPGLNAVPFGPLLAFVALPPGRLCGEGERGNGLAVGSVGGFRLAAEEANEFTRLRFMFSPMMFCLLQPGSRLSQDEETALHLAPAAPSVVGYVQLVRREARFDSG